MTLVAYAETWAAKMEKRITRGEEITARLLWETVDMDLSGYQTGSAYQFLKCYWLHREELVWERFRNIPRPNAHPAKIKRPVQFRRPSFALAVR